MPTTDAVDLRALTDALAAPFELTEIGFKPQNVKGNRALALAYVDARDVQDRLDRVCGIGGWRTEYLQVGPHSVECRLSLRLGDEWVTKADVGSTSDQPDEGDRLKAAYSDGFKRAAVAWGIGRYLYRLDAMWADYDPQKKKFTSTPDMPAWAKPAPKVAPRPVAVKLAAPPVERVAEKAAPAAKLPASGAELHDRLKRKDAQLARDQKCQVGALLTYVTQEGIAKGYGDDMTQWDGPAIAFATDAVKSFMQTLAAEHQPAA